MDPGVEASWGWGLALTALTIALHALGIALLTRLLRRFGRRVAGTHAFRRHPILIATTTLGTVGWLLAALHGLQAAIWAYAYVRLGAIASLHDAMLYSVDSMSTRGASGLRLEPQWALLGALEAGAGMLLFGISTAFAFAVIARVLQLHTLEE